MNRTCSIGIVLLGALAAGAPAQIIRGIPEDRRTGSQSGALTFAAPEYTTSLHARVDRQEIASEKGRELLGRYMPATSIALTIDPGADGYDGLLFKGFDDEDITVEVVPDDGHHYPKVLCTCKDSRAAFFFRTPRPARVDAPAQYVPLDGTIARRGLIGIYLHNLSEGKDAPYRLFTLCRAGDDIYTMLHTGGETYAINMIGLSDVDAYEFEGANMPDRTARAKSPKHVFYFRKPDGQPDPEQATVALYESSVTTTRDVHVTLCDNEPKLPPGGTLRTNVQVRQSGNLPVKTVATSRLVTGHGLLSSGILPRTIKPEDIAKKGTGTTAPPAVLPAGR